MYYMDHLLLHFFYLQLAPRFVLHKTNALDVVLQEIIPGLVLVADGRNLPVKRIGDVITQEN